MDNFIATYLPNASMFQFLPSTSRQPVYDNTLARLDAIHQLFSGGEEGERVTVFGDQTEYTVMSDILGIAG